ncbi:MAG: peptide chain release factor N(5)-glutamine methyltransferase [Dehalococcoidia bacterium]|nr:peptide chain release factor N(5)-glutamine methyltransferase [Dehalococcoidia bacterium]
MTRTEALRWVRQALSSQGIAEAPLEGELLLLHVLGCDRAALYAHGEELITTDRSRRLAALVVRRAQREPLAYIVGHREFYGLDFQVDRRALIPRPETELLVEEALKLYPLLAPYFERPLRIVDVGTGSGCLAVTLARLIPDSQVYATDLSAEALALAEENARCHGVAGRITFLKGDLLQPLPVLADLVVANPPYVKDSEWESLAPEIRAHEPAQALRGGPDGLAVIRRLLAQVPAMVGRPAALVLELGADHGQAVHELANQLFPWGPCEVVREINGRDRALVVQLPPQQPSEVYLSGG